MPLPPLPDKLGTILKDTEAAEAVAKTEMKAKSRAQTKPGPVDTAKAPIKRTQKSIATALPVQEKTPSESSKKAKGYRAKIHGKKLFVLDTNVLMHDPISLFQFEEHDVFYP